MTKSKCKFPVLVSGIPGRENFIMINEFQHKMQEGDYSRIAKKTGYSLSHVWRVLNAERGTNQTILKSARKLVAKRESPYSFAL